MSRKLATAIGVFVVVMAVSAAPALAVSTVEGLPDAGSLPGTAQHVNGANANLTKISGTLFENNDADTYRICISNPNNFSAATSPTPAGGVGDPQLFLFNASGYGVAADDDDGPGLQAALPVGTIGLPAQPKGVYYLSISSFNNDPQGFNSAGALLPIFDSNFVPFPARGPVQQWTTGFAGGTQPYAIHLSGAKFLSGTSLCP